MSSNVVKPRIEIAGSPIDPAIDLLIEQIVVDDSRTLPDMFTLRFRDPDHTVLDKAGLTIGTKVQDLRGPRRRRRHDPADLRRGDRARGRDRRDGNARRRARATTSRTGCSAACTRSTFVDTSEGEIVRRVAQAAGHRAR